MTDRLEEIKAKRKMMDPFDRTNCHGANKIESGELDWLITELEKTRNAHNTSRIQLMVEIKDLTQKLADSEAKVKELETELESLKQFTASELKGMRCTVCGVTFPTPHKEPCKF